MWGVEVGTSLAASFPPRGSVTDARGISVQSLSGAVPSRQDKQDALLVSVALRALVEQCSVRSRYR